MNKIVGFAYKKGVGKDTIAKFLSTYLKCEHPNLRIKQISFAAKLKDICFQLYGWAGLKRGIYYESHREEKEIILLKLGLSPREIWISIGNKLREVYTHTWIDFALNGIEADIIIITDVGFVNEATAIVKRNGWLFKLRRDGLLQGTDGREVELDSWHEWRGIIDNNGSLSALNGVAEEIGKELCS